MHIQPLRGRRTLLDTVRGGFSSGAWPVWARPRRFKRRARSRTASCGHHFGLKKGDMAAIDRATCGVNDVIAHSLKLHPQPLADRLRFHAHVHAEFADAYDDREVTRRRARPRGFNGFGALIHRHAIVWHASRATSSTASSKATCRSRDVERTLRVAEGFANAITVLAA